MRYFLTSWDEEGFECIQDITKNHPDEWDKQELIEILSSRKTSPESNPFFQQLTAMKLRARFNTHRFPEIYAFKADDGIEESQIIAWSESDPQSLVDWIRKNGTCVVSHRRTEARVQIR